MTRLMETLWNYLKEQLLIRYYMIKHVILLKRQNMVEINIEMLRWFTNF